MSHSDEVAPLDPSSSRPCSALYRCIYLWRLGYVVYRHVFDGRKCSIEKGAKVHRVASFVTEREAEDYCLYRNRMMDERGTDLI